MDNNQPNQPPIVPQQPQSNSPTPAPKVKKFDFIMFMNSIPQKLLGSAKNLKSVQLDKRKLLIFGGGGTLILIVLFVAWLYISRPKPRVVISTPTPATAEPIATPIPTKYASDSAVLSIEENLKILDQNLGNTDLQEENIKPRQFDYNVSFR